MIIGTELKIRINVKPIDNISLSECDFTCSFFTTPNKFIEYKKEDLIYVDNDTYLALINSEDLGVGNVKMTIKVLVPDKDFDKGYRTEIDTVSTGIYIKK